jgi:catechol 2,3-dioxygenase-like lactoylglutathione lyase family enzyme
MLNKSKIICFTATTKPELAKDFYENVLGLGLLEDSPFALAFDANGTMLRIQKVPEHVPLKFTALGWQVDDVRASITELSNAGITFERYDHFDQDEFGVWQSPSGAQIAWFKDPDENLLSLTQGPA